MKKSLTALALIFNALNARADDGWMIAPDRHTPLLLNPSRDGRSHTFTLESADGRYFGGVSSQLDRATNQWRPIFDGPGSKTFLIDIAAGPDGQMWELRNGAWHLRGDAAGHPLDYEPFKGTHN